MIRVNNLTKRFGNFSAVDDVSFSVEKGSIFAFLGVNGAGKTTTIKMMTGILKPTSGSVQIGGYDICKNPLEAKYLMGVIPDRPYLYGKLTGREFLYFISDLYKVPRKKADHNIESLLDAYGLNHVQNNLIETYSHGTKQRLAMCSAQVHNPQILIVDEPMVGLDPKGAKLLKDTFLKKASEGMTIFMSTHSLSVAEELADKLAIVQNGKIIALGSLKELFSKTNNQCQNLEKAFLQIISESEKSEDKISLI